MKLAICLVTADRAELTKRTLETFAHFNTGDYGGIDAPPLRACHLLHADDKSVDPYTRRLGELYGFERIPTPNKRSGGQLMRHLLVNEAARRECTHVMILENDWESVRPMPWEDIQTIFDIPEIYCMRLYGVYRERDPVTGIGRRACGKTHYGKGKGTYDPCWAKLGGLEGYEFGDIHWGAPPNITRTKEAVWLHDGTRSEGQIRKKCAQMKELTARVVDNVFYHIGENRTPEFKQ